MKNFLIAFVVFLVWSFFGLWLYSWLQPVDKDAKHQDSIATNEVTNATLDINDRLELGDTLAEINTTLDTVSLIENEEEPAPETTLPAGLKATTPGGELVFLFSEGIWIRKNTDQIEYSTSIADFRYKLNSYISEHPRQELHINSLYSASENIVNPNFGFQRGSKVKGILSRTGIPDEKMVIKTMIREIEFNNKSIFENGISFSFHPLDTARVENLRLSLPETKTIYPKLVNNDIFVNEALQELLVEVKSALQSDPKLKVEVIGHTDNIGNANDNYLLGLRFARQVRWYMVTKGKLDPKRVIAISKGESLSIATNRTERGRLLNRRIEIKYTTH